MLNRDPVCTTPETPARSRWNGPELPQFYGKNPAICLNLLFVSFQWFKVEILNKVQLMRFCEQTALAADCECTSQNPRQPVTEQRLLCRGWKGRVRRSLA